MKADATTLKVTVVEATSGGIYHLACKDGVHNWCSICFYISMLPETTVELMDLSDIFKN